MAAKLEVVNEDNNQYILEYLSRIEASTNPCEFEKFSNSLNAYLVKLDVFMAERETCDIIKQLPSAGKLLSKISKIFNRKGGVPDILVDCILKLSNIPESLNSSSRVERKVGEWATEQLQICYSSYLRQEDADFMDCLGISQNEFIDAQIAEVASMLLSENYMKKTNFDSCSLCRATEILLLLLDEPRVKSLIQSVLTAIERSFKVSSNETHESSLKRFLVAVSKNRKLVKDLSNDSRMSLWKCHLPAFELEILGVARTVWKSPFIDDQSITKLLKEKFQLILDYCIEDDLSYECANNILRASVLELGCYPSLTSLVHIFSLIVRKEKQKKRSVGLKFSENFFTALPLTLDGLNNKEQESLMKVVVAELKEMRHSTKLSNYDLWYLLVQNKHYVKSALHLSLHGSYEVLDCILELLIVYYCPNSRQNGKIKKILKQFTMNIRGLLCKKILQPSDLLHPIEVCKKGMSDDSNLMYHLVRDLVLNFLVNADASQCILREVFSAITTGFPNSVKLDLWLRTLEDNTLSIPYQAANFSADKKHVFSILAYHFLERCKSELSDTKFKPLFASNGEQSQILADRVVRIPRLFNH